MDTSPFFYYGIFNLIPASSHTEGLKRTELQFLPWIGAKREIPFSWDRDVLSCRAGLFLQRVHQAGEAIPLLCHMLAGKFAWLGFVIMVSRMGQTGGAGLPWGGTWPRWSPGTQLWCWSGSIPLQLVEALGCLPAVCWQHF